MKEKIDGANVKKKREAKKYNDILVIGIVLLTLLVMEITLLFFNRMFILNFFGMMNDILFFTIIVLLINFIPHPVIKKVLLTVFLALFTVLFAIDATYSGFFSGFTSVNSLSSLGNLFTGKEGLGVRITLSSIIILLEAAAGFFFIWFIKLHPHHSNGYFKYTIPISMCLIALITGANISSTAVIKNKEYNSKIDYYTSNTFLYNTFYNSTKYTSKFGYVNFRLRDIVYKNASTEAVEDITDFFETRPADYSNGLSGIFEGYNVITVLCESMDTRIIDKKLMPKFSGIMEQSVIFDNYYVPTFFQGATINTEFMTLASMFPISAKSWVTSLGDQYKNNYFGDYSLPGQLGKKGYDTYYMHLGYEAFYSRNKLMPNMGFDSCKFIENLPYSADFFDTELVDLLDYVDFSEKFYVDMLTYSMHKGNDGKYATTNSKNPNSENYKFVMNNYPDVSRETQVFYTKAKMFDDFTEKLFNRLEEENVLDNTIVLFYPDHYYYTSNGDLLDDLGLDPSNKEIHNQLLTMYLPAHAKQQLLDYAGSYGILNGYETAAVLPNLGSSIDITPTVLNLLSTDSNYRYFAGRDIFDEENFVFFSDYTVYSGRTFFDIDKNLYTYDPTVTQSEMEASRPYLETVLENYIELSLKSTIMLDLDYFRKIL